MNIKNISRLKKNCKVFDIEVETDHSFIVNECVLHNCIACGYLSGQIFDSIDKIPMYPKHANCRCTCIPLPEDIDESEIRETYSEWFERQSDKTKYKVLGKTRFQLYEQGMKIKKFVNNGNITPVKELKHLNQTK